MTDTAGRELLRLEHIQMRFGAITALVIYGLHLRWALSRYAAGLAVPTG